MPLIGLDIGTTGCKAIVFDAGGQVLGQAFREYDVICDAPAKAEQDAGRVWSLAKAALREAVVEAHTDRIQALSVSVQGDAVIPVDADFNPLHPAILGMDYRPAPQTRRCEELFGGFELFERTGMRPHPMNSLAKVLWLREHAPEVCDRAWKIVTYADFILGRLGAEAVIDETMASRTMAFDLHSRRWDAELHRRLGLEVALWSRPVPSGTAVGEIRSALAQELGLAHGRVTLVTGGHDQACAALGAGLIEAGRGVVSTGTAEVLSTAFDHPVLDRGMFDGFYPCYLHAKPGMYFTFALNHVGGILLRWWRDQLGASEVAAARSRSQDAYEAIIQQFAPGPSPVMVVPHFNGSGTPHCDLQARGAILGLTLGTTRHDIAKALLEGLTFEMRVNLDAMRACGIEVGELTAVGGGARSAAWLQLKADILGRPIRTLACREAACLGAALLAGVATGDYASLDEGVKAAVRPDREFVPDPVLTPRYRERFDIYRRLYPALREVNAALARA